MAKHTKQELYQWQALPLNIKVLMTAERIRNWVNEFGENGVYLSFSAGKDSTVLGHIIREVCGYKNIPFVFVDVPTQYPELKQFAKTFDNLVILKPKISFAEVCEKYGFPMFSKEISECVADSKKYIRILTDRQTGRQADRQTGRQAGRDSVCLSHSRLDRSRQESRQRKQSIYRFENGEYP